MYTKANKAYSYNESQGKSEKQLKEANKFGCLGIILLAITIFVMAIYSQF